MTNARNETILRYFLPNDPEVHEAMIGWNETPKSFLIRIDKKDSYHVMDANGREFPADDNLFGHPTLSTARPVNIVHGLNVGSGKKRVVSALKDNREKIEVSKWFSEKARGGHMLAYSKKRGQQKTKDPCGRLEWSVRLKIE
jgi:hypothetical protein